MNYDAKRAALIEYLKVKTAEADWHGVSDAANDLRVLEAQHAAEPKSPPKPLWKGPYRTCIHQWNFNRDGFCPTCLGYLKTKYHV